MFEKGKRKMGGKAKKGGPERWDKMKSLGKDPFLA